MDHCRIGSLEILTDDDEADGGDHCRIGSLEIYPCFHERGLPDHCRIGSLEIILIGKGILFIGSLPHRQLRNMMRKWCRSFTGITAA